MREIPIRKLALVVGNEMAGGPAPSPFLASELPQLTGSYVSIMEGLLAEGGRARPQRATRAGFGYIAGAVLLTLRQRASEGDAASGRAIEASIRLVRLAVAHGMDPLTLLTVSRAFATAQLDPGPALHPALATALTKSLRLG